jgi:hypothetical protein
MACRAAAWNSEKTLPSAQTIRTRAKAERKAQGLTGGLATGFWVLSPPGALFPMGGPFGGGGTFVGSTTLLPGPQPAPRSTPTSTGRINHRSMKNLSKETYRKRTKSGPSKHGQSVAPTRAALAGATGWRCLLRLPLSPSWADRGQVVHLTVHVPGGQDNRPAVGALEDAAHRAVAHGEVDDGIVHA